MKQQTQTTQQKPLWKVLNEQRTQGEWQNCEFEMLHGVEYCIKESKLFKENKWQFADRILEAGNYTKENRFNVAYAALAVNNLSYLAEALEKCIKFSSKDPQLIRDIAREALNRIS